MEYLVFLAVMSSLALILFLKGTWDKYRQDQYFRKCLLRDYGKLPDRTYQVERFQRIGSYWKKHPQAGQLDDITWNDLNMDEIFKGMNHTFSSTGEEYLYYTLRTPQFDDAVLKEQEKIVEYFRTHQEDRIRIQFLMRELGSTGKYSLYDYLEHLELLGKRSNTKIWILDGILLLLLLYCAVNPSLGLCAFAFLAVYQITTYFKTKKDIEPYLISFTYVMRLLRVTEKLLKYNIPVCDIQWKQIREAADRLKSMKLGSSWVLTGSHAVGSGNPLEILMDYLNMIFHIDILFFHKMLHDLNSHLEEVDVLVTELGMLETAISIGAFRESAKQGWCVPTLEENKEGIVSIQNAYHPLLTNAVKNSVTAKKGVLLTGSNASGKSTFLKTVAINAILAQTIYTCTAEYYRASFFRICSSMALRDDLGSGESYYIVEIKALKRILEMAEKPIYSEIPILCFVDEVLRGTNTIERIAASSQILKSLGGKRILCFAATHDMELTDLLTGYYENYHFEEEIRDGDITFNYRLQEGKATTRNAIRLLELIGYEEEIISQANQMAEHFVQSGEWEL